MKTSKEIISEMVKNHYEIARLEQEGKALDFAGAARHLPGGVPRRRILPFHVFGQALRPENEGENRGHEPRKNRLHDLCRVPV